MRKVFIIAIKEFLATVATKGFIFGMLFPPIILGAIIMIMPALMNKKPPAVFGHVAVIDRSGAVAPRLVEALSPEAIEARRKERSARVREAIDQGAKSAGLDPSTTKAISGEVDKSLKSAEALTPDTSLRVVVLPPETDEESAKDEIRKGGKRDTAASNGTGAGTGTSTGTSTSGNAADPGPRLALIIIPDQTVRGSDSAPPGARFGEYQLLTAPRLDIEVQSDLRSQANRAIVDARLALAGQNVAQIRELMQSPAAKETTVTADGTASINEVTKLIVPAAFMFLLWISVFSSGQYLLMSTIEEKSSRVMEVILSAVSPMQLMCGKIIGKGAVGVLILALYSGVGITALIFFAVAELVPWQNLVYLGVYFALAYAVIACFMAAVGAAVNDINEAQTLMGPIMLILVIPMMLWLPILRNPNSTFAEVCSFVPMINPFVMVLRLCGSEPIPFWQVPASIAVGMATVLFMAWASAKIFRIGVLMYGKPPNFATLVRWVRMA